MERWITANTPVRSTFEHAARMLVEAPQDLLADGPGEGPTTLNLTVDVGAGSAVRQDVVVAVGVPRTAEGEAWVPITWEPAGHAHLLPSFDGVIEVVDGATGTQLLITGSYRVPLGVVGRFGDGIVGRRLAQQSVQRLVEQLGGRLDERVTEQLAHAGYHPAPYPIDVR